MTKILKILILTFLGAVTITSCSDDSEGNHRCPCTYKSTEKQYNPEVAESKTQ